MNRWITACLFSLSLSVWAAPAVPVLTLADSINPGSGDFLIDAIEEAEKNRAPYIVIVLDTPGGLLTTTRLIVQKILGSSIPVVVFVGPKGARAGSAGALITFAADVAAMAPATNIGAAHPVSGGGEKMDETMSAKITNDTAAFAESVAKTRGRNAEWAIKSVRDSASVTAEEALKQGVIDLIAEDVPNLKDKLAGFRFKAPKGATTQIPSTETEYHPYPMGLKYRVVSFFADPNLAYMILSLGAVCIWIELSHPGLILPGVVGVLCIVISMVSFQLLPISYGALSLIFLGLGFIVAELFLPTYGVLGVGGVLAFIFGSLFLMDSNAPELQISLKLILPTAAALTAIASLIGYVVLRAQKGKHLSGLEALVGEYGEVNEPVSHLHGKVFIQGELWNAVSESEDLKIPKGAVVVVKQIQKMHLVVAEKA